MPVIDRQVGRSIRCARPAIEPESTCGQPDPQSIRSGLAATRASTTGFSDFHSPATAWKGGKFGKLDVGAAGLHERRHGVEARLLHPAGKPGEIVEDERHGRRRELRRDGRNRVWRRLDVEMPLPRLT